MSLYKATDITLRVNFLKISYIKYKNLINSFVVIYCPIQFEELVSTFVSINRNREFCYETLK